MESTTVDTVKFETAPLKLTDNNLVVFFDKLNAELLPYKIRVDSISDIFIDAELSAINAGTVLKIQAVALSPDGVWDEEAADWFFNKAKEVEDKFESLPEVYSCELDRGDMLFTIILNAKDVALEKKLATGGPVEENPDAEYERMVDAQLKNNAAQVFSMLGIPAPVDDADRIAKFAQARSMSIEKYKAAAPKPVMAFFQGHKINLASGASHSTVNLQQALMEKFMDYAAQNLKGGSDQNFARNYANNSAIWAIDMLKGMATNAPEGAPFLITDQMLAEIVNKIVSTKTV